MCGKKYLWKYRQRNHAILCYDCAFEDFNKSFVKKVIKEWSER